MKIFLGVLTLVSCAIHHVTSLGHRREVESWRSNPLFVSQNSNVRNPLLLGSSTSLNVLDKLHNIRNKLEEIENKNNDLPIVSPVRGPENQFQSINSFVDDLSKTSDNKERANAFEIRPLSLLEKIPVMPSSLNGYFMMFRLKQNISNSVPTKSQTRFSGNEQQQYIQQISTQKPEPAVNQHQPLTIQRQNTSHQQSLNNQQMHSRRLNIHDQLSNHRILLSSQQNLVGQQQFSNNEVQNFLGQQTSTNQQQPVRDQRSPVNSQHFSNNERRTFNVQQNLPRPISNQKTVINQHLSPRNFNPSIQQQPDLQLAHQTPDQRGILSINHQSTINHYIRPQGRTTERIASNMRTTENPSKMADNFEIPSGQQIQKFTDELLTKIQTQALNGESQPAFVDNHNRNIESRIFSAGAARRQESLLTNFERSPVVPVMATATGSQILHETRLSNGASVKQHLKTPYTNYDFSHLL